MRVLLTGASGFIGRQLHRRLCEAGHHVIFTGSSPAPDGPRCGEWIPLRFHAASRVEDWLPVTGRIDACINAAGVFRARSPAELEAVHVTGPAALFAACAARGVRRVVQLSALHAEPHADTEFLATKGRADMLLLQTIPEAAVVRPSLVFGAGGQSARLFLSLASLPVIPLPGAGDQRLQPVHVDDLVEAIVTLIEHGPEQGWSGSIDAVGPRALTLRSYLTALREGLRLHSAPEVRLPSALVAAAARLGNVLPGGLLDTDAWKLLQQGSVAPPDRFADVLGRSPRDVHGFLSAADAASWKDRVVAARACTGMRLSLALLWIVTALLSFGLYPREMSYELLAWTGIAPRWQPWILDAAAGLDLLLGIATLVLPQRSRHALWLLQLGLMAAYTAIITWKLPGFWLHPFGPVLKNLPLAAMLAALLLLDRPRQDRWTT